MTSWQGRRVLVTGGTGFVGRHVLAKGVAAGVELHNLSRDRHADANVRHHQVDLTDRGLLFRLLDEIKPDGILHLAAAGVAHGTNDLAVMLRANTLGTDNVLAAAEALGSRPPVIIAGSGFEYAAQDRPLTETDPLVPFSVYGVSKLAATFCAKLHSSELPITLLRLFSIYGPGERLPRLLPYVIACAKAGEPVELTKCEQLRDYVYVEDVAESFWRALFLPPEIGLRILNVGTGKAVTLKQFVVTLTDILRSLGLAPDVKFGARPYRPGEPMTYLADVARMRGMMEWIPSVELKDGLTRSVQQML